jgi:hypothetical protein
LNSPLLAQPATAHRRDDWQELSALADGSV